MAACSAGVDWEWRAGTGWVGGGGRLTEACAEVRAGRGGGGAKGEGGAGGGPRGSRRRGVG